MGQLLISLLIVWYLTPQEVPFKRRIHTLEHIRIGPRTLKYAEHFSLVHQNILTHTLSTYIYALQLSL